MALEVYFKDDLRQGAVMVTVAMLSAAVAHGGTNTEYCRGVLDTARALALDFGISWGSIVGEVLGTLTNGRHSDVLYSVVRSSSEQRPYQLAR